MYRAFCLIAIFAASGCAHGASKTVYRDTQGGTLALHGPYTSARQDAQRQMASHCRGRYAIVDENNISLGQRPIPGLLQTGDGKLVSSSRYQETLRDTYEYRITYQCKFEPAPAKAVTPKTPPLAPPAAQDAVSDEPAPQDAPVETEEPAAAPLSE